MYTLPVAMLGDDGHDLQGTTQKRGWRGLLALLRPGNTLYRDAHYLAVEIDVDAVAARRWLPWPLRPSRPARATVFTAWFPWTVFGSVYREAGVLLHAEHRGVACVHSPWMIVDDDVALVAGRELLGYPKKLGEIDWSLVADRVDVVARRRGATLIEMHGTLGEPEHDAPPILGRPHRNVRCTMSLALPRLVAFTPAERPLEVRRAQLELKITGSERDPLHTLGLGAVHSARLHRVDLGAGRLPRSSSFVSPLSYADRLLTRVL